MIWIKNVVIVKLSLTQATSLFPFTRGNEEKSTMLPQAHTLASESLK
jgi:hypothetical protein